ncbi:hypothetical protein INS49_010943 [Diaporthe citri]|uniref:uncharacterized protein n=1 Tax=Diaporthe citri TaxID=83186 RepID=UPI001C815F73|nr:uncharacterized protein INS49_010943 [Diaporthe citri]KAG6359890.1 hypothetical protein INS49_010943 [Diaporthe citri]
MTMDTVTRVTPRRTDELTGRATSTVQKDQARVLEFQLPAAPFTDGLVSLTATSFPLACAPPQSWGERGARDHFKRTQNYYSLHRFTGRPLGRSGAPTSLGVVRSWDGIQNITDLNHGLWYGVNVTFGTQELTLVLDTGSSDTWAFSTATQCVETTGGDEESAGGRDDFCVFGPPSEGDFPLGTFEHLHFSTDYWGNQTVNGALGLMDVTVGGLRVTNQTVGLATNATRWLGRGPSSGVLGLAYPGLTKAFTDSGIRADPILYPPVISNMIEEGIMQGGFSLALNRPGSGENGGVIAFGGVPDDVPGVDWNMTIQTDIIIAIVDDEPALPPDYSFYTIISDGWQFKDAILDDRKIAYNIDSGTPFNCPKDLHSNTHADTANYIADAYIPPAKYNATYGVYFVDCDAIAPDVAVDINGMPFWLNPEGLVVGRLTASQDQSCFAAFTDCGWTGPYVLGNSFLQNVLAIFDVEDRVIEFVSRTYY